MARPDNRELGPEELKALTHPVRVRILKELRSDGPATASLLARRLGESSGVTSYHLRQLERHGFVEDAPDIGDGRDRWWRPTFGGHSVRTERFLDDPEQAAVVQMYEANVVEVHARQTAEWVATQSDWGPEWAEATALNDYRLRLVPARLKELTEAVHDLVESFREDDEALAEGENVVVVFQAFPRRVRPFAEES
jgi:DNA-binding transcriptional ArsR family regulator